MKKIAFLDRDGTIIVEPPRTHQINGLEEMSFLPEVISSLKKLAENGYEFALITNQDHLGKPQNPRENYETVNRKMFEILRGEGVEFRYIFECPHPVEENCACRKPKTGMIGDLMEKESVDHEKSFVVGDRETDMEFARRIGLRGFLLSHAVMIGDIVKQEGEGMEWPEIVSEVLCTPRKVNVSRKTKETDITLFLNVDGSGKAKIVTGLGFLDHMLENVAKHGLFDLELKCTGDLQVDEHHTVEDIALALGEAFYKVSSDKRGMNRYAHEMLLPMDEAISYIALDFGGRPYLRWEAVFEREYIGDLPTELIEHFFRSFCDTSKINLHVRIDGKNTHHMIESAFKAFARCLSSALQKTGNSIPSTKGTL